MARDKYLIPVFKDTMQFIESNETLKTASSKSQQGTKLYLADDWPEIPDKSKKSGNTSILQYRSFEAARYMHNLGNAGKIAVLNFASATNPGGGVLKGSLSQEESLCRCSTLYPSLATHWLKRDFYEMHKKRDDITYTDACIYTPGVIVCKDDSNMPERLEEKHFLTVDVITCSAPNLRNVYIESTSQHDLMLSRVRHIFHIAHVHGVDTLILGAFGCGAFRNNPYIVARCFDEVMEKHREDFENIVFAIYGVSQPYDNYRVFKAVLGLTD